MSKSPFHPSKTGLKLAALTLGLACAAQSMAATDLTVISFGGANKDAQNKAFYQPFEKATGNKIVAGEYNGEMAKVKAMVDTNSVTWDLVEVESPELARGCDEGMFEEIDPAILGKAEDYVPGAVSNCGVGFFVWSTVLAYNADKLKTAPTGWADFWDLKKYPGKRGLRKGAKYTLEFALMADGVAPKDVYKVLATKEGQDRAFKKLDEIKPSIQWWEAGAQPLSLLASGEVVMATAWNGRIFNANKVDKKNFKIVWDGQLMDYDLWAIPKGVKDLDAVYKFIQFASSPEAQAAQTKYISYGPALLAATPLVAPDILKD
ncbi:MAG: ABC transporter substrate-binding protein, partial [Starkeya sp.]|nr:ABC transporter substrate-binding protein [Starkeya sp.]